MDTRTGARAQSVRFVSYRVQVTGTFDGADLEQPEPGTLYVTLQYDNEQEEDERWNDLQLQWSQGKHLLQSKHQALRVQSVCSELMQLLRDADALQELHQQQVGAKRARGAVDG